MDVYVGYENEGQPLEVFTDKGKLLDWIMESKFSRNFKVFNIDAS